MAGLGHADCFSWERNKHCVNEIEVLDVSTYRRCK